MDAEELKNYIRNVPDFPKSGIMFKDITPLLKDKYAFSASIKLLADHIRNLDYDYIAGIDSRGFIISAALANELNSGLLLIRKKGKLPYHTVSIDYQLEYGSDSLEMHEDSIKKGDKVIIVDDLLATGGTSGAAAKLIEKLGGQVSELTFMIELSDLKGKDKLKDYPIYSLLKY
ncbi:adenine phosphoribosyltransferase [Candidatus Mancarchaeum acidiphilum]|uniref:Adenine phosphoribosyltransferase n=1 Tax=Candidatus Mancarchaeum acidiphilum TaxID=1920749 RepID=A0A218NP74_9ARCH|nr:adenine phosphoribosyltransferase [Candidatus Mancarchaeum acidiphilum]ASI14265.1 adenine phosphoribosyltransferase [Candidatus Mancarchaeum acidiphilum]